MAKKKIRLDDGSQFTLRGGKLYRSLSGEDYANLVKEGNLVPKDGKLYVAPTEKMARDLSVPFGSDEYVVEIDAKDISSAFRDKNVPKGSTSFYLDKSVPIKRVKVKANDGKFKPFVKLKGSVEFEVDEGAIKGVGLNGRNVANEDTMRQLYQKAADDLFEIIQKADPTKPFGQYRNEQLGLINKVLRGLDGNVRQFTDKQLGDVIVAGFEDMGKKIAAIGEGEFTFKFSGLNKEAISVLTERAYGDFANTMRGIGIDAQNAALNKYAIENEIVAGAIQGSSFSRTTREVLQELKGQGFKVLVARSGRGRKFNLAHYSNMLVRSQNILAYNQGGKQRLLTAGRRFAKFPTIRPDIDGEDICNQWERKIILDLEKDPLPPESTHPNCRHTAQPISFAQLKAKFPKQYRIALRYYEETAKG